MHVFQAARGKVFAWRGGIILMVLVLKRSCRRKRSVSRNTRLYMQKRIFAWHGRGTLVLLVMQEKERRNKEE